MIRKILHLDLDAFFCAVEEWVNPSLKNKPFAVGGKPGTRSVISSASYPARKYGIQSAMPVGIALQKLPSLIIVTPNYQAYSQASKQVMVKLHSLTPLVEQVSVDEAFLDVSDISQPPVEIARALQASIWDELELPCSIGVASNKLVAKIATDYGKLHSTGDGAPNAVTVVPPGEEEAFLAPLPVRAMWGVGPKMAASLIQKGLTTIGDVARVSEDQLIEIFGKFGHYLALHSKGIENRLVETSHDIKSISQETTFDKDISHEETLRKTLFSLTQRVCKRMRKSEVTGLTVKIKVRWPDFTTITRQTTLNFPTNQDQEIFSEIIKLFYSIWQPGKKVRLIGVGVTNFSSPSRQISFWDADHEKEKRLLQTIDSLQQQYGKNIIRRG